MTSTSTILNQVLNERLKQDAKWGAQSRELSHWLSILVEEVGEFSTELNHWMMAGPVNEPESTKRGGPKDAMRAELVQCAAVVVAIIEQIDNGSAYVRLSSPDVLETVESEIGHNGIGPFGRPLGKTGD